ncbi:MAG: hypothetical protein GWP91_26055 [Rhodobacterales bacterium]|nr:hypothetical protein [Rhodobacterales bacterium]
MGIGLVDVWETGVSAGWNEGHTMLPADFGGDGIIEGLQRLLFSEEPQVSQVTGI